jgi:hypothetical protein
VKEVHSIKRPLLLARAHQVQHAILLNKLDLLWALKAAGADMNAEDNQGRGTPLRFAVSMRCVDAALELLQMDVDPDAPLAGTSLLHALCLPPSFARDAELLRALVGRTHSESD